MVSRFLVTTALESTWPVDKSVLFLGEWCRLYDRKAKWTSMHDTEVLPYHWDDRKKLFSDYQYLINFYERLLESLAGQLNEKHGVDHGLQYWRILVGPWLGYFIQILFDRWSCLKAAEKNYDLSGTVVLQNKKEQFIPLGMDAFIPLLLDDEGNHDLCSQIIKNFTNIDCVDQEAATIDVDKASTPGVLWRHRFKHTLINSYIKFASRLARDHDMFFLATYLPLKDEMLLQVKMKQFPQLWRSVSPVSVEANLEQRKWLVSGDNLSDFEICARTLIPQNIPILYLEGYGALTKQVAQLPWPRSPSVMWTSNCYIADDVFKAWAAEKNERDSSLVIGQHGGHNGMGLWSYPEEHELAISDFYFSWGWSKAGFETKIKPVGQLKSKRPLGVDHARQPGALLVAGVPPRYSYKMYSGVVARQWIDCFEGQCQFVKLLPKPICDALTVRFYPHDYEWNQRGRWRDRFPDLQLDGGEININQLIGQSRLYISTYNAATYLESFTMNIPTILFWDSKHWELRESAIPFFDDLKHVGIFHDTPESAAKHVTKIWGGIEDWWNDEELRLVLDRFKNNFCYLPDKLLSSIKKTLNEIVTQKTNYNHLG